MTSGLEVNVLNGCTQSAATPDVPLTVQHVLDAGLGDDGIVTLEPLVLVLPDEAGVVAALQGPLVVNYGKQGVPGTGARERGEKEQSS